MNFYFSLFQLIETVERLERDVQHLASRALRISPRDARANRELLEQCDLKVTEVKNLLNNKTHISKITLRKAALLFQLLEVFYRRLLHLASASSNIGLEDENSVKALWQLLALAQSHYQGLVKTLFDLTGIPLNLSLNGAQEIAAHEFPAVLQKEAAYQAEALKHLEKAIEVFGEEQELADELAQMRKDLLDVKKRMKHLSNGQTVEKAVEKAEPRAPISTPTLSKN
jgi:hypothetical protein